MAFRYLLAAWIVAGLLVSWIDQAAFAQVATSASVEQLTSADVYRITDQSLLARVATTHSSRLVREAAVERLTDQAVLAHIATTDRG